MNLRKFYTYGIVSLRFKHLHIEVKEIHKRISSYKIASKQILKIRLGIPHAA